ncbi:MAG: hypothetical protein ACKO96_01845, partial [Flammeovirgaceae bacterium]
LLQAQMEPQLVKIMLLFTAHSIKESVISQQGSSQIQLLMQEILELFQDRFLHQQQMETVIITKK